MTSDDCVSATYCCCAAFSCCIASSYPSLIFFSSCLRWFSTDSISSAQPCSSWSSSYTRARTQIKIHSDEHINKKPLLICVRWTLSVADTSARALLHLHSRIQALIQLANLLSQLLQVIGLVQDVRVHLEETHRHTDRMLYLFAPTCKYTFVTLLKQMMLPVHKTPPD